MTSGGQCVMTAGTPLTLLWSADSWDIHTLEVSLCIYRYNIILCSRSILQTHIHSGGTAYSNAHFGAGTGSIFLDDVQCASSASQLLECSSSPILTHNCQHSADAGVGCGESITFDVKPSMCPCTVMPTKRITSVIP